MSTLTLQVNNSLSVNVLPNQEHEFLMTSKEVAEGYGVNQITIRRHLTGNTDDFKEGKHYVKGVQIMSTLSGTNLQPHQTFWTKRGIIRLGFFIRSERARQFRDWAEDLIIYTSENSQQAQLEARVKELESKLHNGQTPAIEAPSFDKLQENMAEFFKKWLQHGDLKKIADQTGLSYTHVRLVRVHPSRSKRISQMLYELCLKNRAESDNKNKSLN